MKFILAKKKKMESHFDEGTGKMRAVTIVEAGPCFVSQIKKVENDGYSGVQIAYGTRKNANKPILGHFKKLGANKFVKEFRVEADEASKFVIGDKLTVSSFEAGDDVGVTGTSKGRGFAGVVKRYGFAGGPASHGHKDQLRMPGSIGATDPGRVFKGMRMGGHMGDAQVTIKGLTILEVRPETNELVIQGAVPGATNGYLIIKGNGEMTPEKASEKPVETKKEEPKKNEPVAEQPKEEKNEEVKDQPKADEPQAQEVKA